MSARSSAALVGTAILALAPLEAAPQEAPPHEAGQPGARAQIAPPMDGAALFQDRCVLCHAAGGTGTFMLARRLGKERSLLAERSDLSADYVKQIVRHGLFAMPRFTRVELTDAELAAVAAFLSAPKKPG